MARVPSLHPSWAVARVAWILVGFCWLTSCQSWLERGEGSDAASFADWQGDGPDTLTAKDDPASEGGADSTKGTRSGEGASDPSDAAVLAIDPTPGVAEAGAADTIDVVGSDQVGEGVAEAAERVAEGASERVAEGAERLADGASEVGRDAAKAIGEGLEEARSKLEAGAEVATTEAARAAAAASAAIEDTAGAAGIAGDAASTAAGAAGATGTAEGATGTAEGATGTAEGATGTAEGATGTAEGATGTAEGATGTAEGATGTAKGATGTAEGATGTAKGATGTAKGATGTAKGATGTAKGATGGEPGIAGGTPRASSGSSDSADRVAGTAEESEVELRPSTLSNGGSTSPGKSGEAQAMTLADAGAKTPTTAASSPTTKDSGGSDTRPAWIILAALALALGTFAFLGLRSGSAK